MSSLVSENDPPLDLQVTLTWSVSQTSFPLLQRKDCILTCNRSGRQIQVDLHKDRTSIMSGRRGRSRGRCH